MEIWVALLNLSGYLAMLVRARRLVLQLRALLLLQSIWHNTGMVAHNHTWFQSQGVWYPLLTVMKTYFSISATHIQTAPHPPTHQSVPPASKQVLWTWASGRHFRSKPSHTLNCRLQDLVWWSQGYLFVMHLNDITCYDSCIISFI